MAEKSVRVPIARAPVVLRLSDSDGNHIHNQILLRLPVAEREIVFPKLELVRLKDRQMLHEVGDTLKSAYFCNTGMISILTVFSDGKSIEAGLIGKEGFVGIPLVAGFRSSATRAVVQVEATALRIDAEALSGFLRQCQFLERQLQQCSQMMGMEATQIAACNRLHPVEQRLARWLLMCSDRLGTKSLPLTQELLALMLGTQRAQRHDCSRHFAEGWIDCPESGKRNDYESRTTGKGFLRMLRNDATAETAVGKRFRLTCWPECALGSITAHGELFWRSEDRCAG